MNDRSYYSQSELSKRIKNLDLSESIILVSSYLLCD